MIIRGSLQENKPHYSIVDFNVFGTYAEALHKSQELAGISSPHLKFIVVAVAAVVQSVSNPTIITSYRL
jgi:hypothetical protein